MIAMNKQNEANVKEIRRVFNLMQKEQAEEQQAPHAVTFMSAFFYWLKLGFISFGGPAGQISMMHQELVEKRRWISEQRFLHGLNFTMLLPGPEAQQLATYIGWLMFGSWGGVVAGLLFVLPSLIILMGLTWIYLVYGNVPLVAGILYGIKPAVTAIVIFAAYRIGSRALKNNLLRCLALFAFLAIFIFNLAFPYVLLIAATIGFIGAYYFPQKFKVEGHASSTKDTYGPAIIDDHTPIPTHALFKWPRLVLICLVGLILWALSIYCLAYLFGWQGTLTQMGLFFTKAALVTFGGAYAVLPYVYQGGVEQYGWLTAPQMIDGLALGETTPGPLIMVVAYVGYVGAWSKQVFGPDSLALAGAVGAGVVTFFTFLPSFLFILIGGPIVEASRNEIKLTAPLTAITASVVGVIANLAMFFAYHVFWPEGFNAGFDWFSLLIGLLSLLALFRFKIDIMPVIFGCAMVGAGYSFLI